MFEEGAIIGVQQILFNTKWQVDIICGKAAVVCKLKWEKVNEMILENVQGASRLYSFLMRHYCLLQMHDPNIDNQHLTNFKNINEKDLLYIEYKLKIKNHRDKELFDLIVNKRKSDGKKADAI